MSFHGGYVDPNRPNPMGSNDARVIIYGYVPSIALSVLGIVLFSLATLIHAGQVVRYRWWSFSPIVVACLMEVVGYTARYLSGHRDPYNIIYFVIQYFFIVVAPVLISASIYVCLTKLLQWAEDETGNPIGLKRKPILWVFITADVVTTIIQITGAAMIGSKTHKLEDPTTANNILTAGLAIQTFFFIIFLVLFTRFIVELYKVGLEDKKLLFLRALAAASVLVFIRTVFRLAETAEGVFSFLSSHEALFGTLEFAPIALAVVILAAWHPARWLPDSSIQGTRKSERVMEEGRR